MAVDIAEILRAIFYLWLLAAIGVYAYRGYRALLRRGTKDDTSEVQAADATTTPTAGGADTATIPDAPRPGAAPIPSPAETPKRTFRSVIEDRPPAAPTEPIADGGLVASVIREELAERERAAQAAAGTGPTTDADTEAEAGRRGLFAPTGAGDERDRAAQTSKPVSELLQGIEMPCDLSPLISADAVVTPHHVAFVTTGVPPADVGSKVGDELERLHFALRSDSDTEVVATRGDDVLRVTLHPDADAIRIDGERLFPSVPNGSVVVEFRS